MSLDRFERAMLESAHGKADAPDPARKDSARRAMLEAAGVAAAVTTVATSAKAASAKAATTKAVSTVAVAKAVPAAVPTLVKAGLFVTVVAGSAAGVHVMTRSASEPLTTAAPQTTATASAAPRPPLVVPPPASAMPTETPGRITTEVTTIAASDLPSARIVDAPRPPAKAADVPADDPLAAETKLLARARDALASGDRNAARTALRDHDMRFPRGALSNEAELLAIDLAIADGDRAEARRRAGLLLAKDPQSPWRARLQKLTQEAP